MNDMQMNSEFPKAIGGPARRALDAAGITRLEQLTRVSAAELLKLHGVGPKAVRILGETLAAHGLSFAEPDKSQAISDAANARIERRQP